MRKKTIAYLFVPAIILFIIGAVLASVGASQSSAALALVGLVAYLVGLVLYLISWIGSLVATGKQGRWGWFVCIFLLSPIAELVYLFAGPGVGSAAAAATQG